MRIPLFMVLFFMVGEAVAADQFKLESVLCNNTKEETCNVHFTFSYDNNLNKEQCVRTWAENYVPNVAFSFIGIRKNRCIVTKFLDDNSVVVKGYVDSQTMTGSFTPYQIIVEECLKLLDEFEKEQLLSDAM